jgi:hypothetical protein
MVITMALAETLLILLAASDLGFHSNHEEVVVTVYEKG